MFFARLFVASLLAFAACSQAAETLTGKRPNIIFILTDDQGYGDISAHGNPILKTPNLDRLHNEGVRFLDFHVSPTCAPTRSALFTGRHEFRNGVTHTIYERERLTLKATTLPQILQQSGYATGIFGKWHLGDEAEYQPGRRGFDEVFIHGAGGIGQAYPGSCGDAPGNSYFDPYILHNGVFEKTKGYCTDVFFRQAESWVEKTKGTKPFFCYIPTNAPHGPLDVPESYEALYKDKVPIQGRPALGKTPSAAKYFGMIANIDENVGKLLDKLRLWDLERDTLVIFMNDNGGTAGCRIFNAGMRGQKGSPWLGGTRASSFWRWPGTLTPVDVKPLCAHVDFFRTITDLTGSKISPELQKQVEGRSLLPLLQNPSAPWEDRTLFTHVGRWEQGQPPETGKYSQCSVRTTQWHLVNEGRANKKSWQLFDIAKDPGEAQNVAAQHPEIVSKMDADYEKWWSATVSLMVNEGVPLAAENPFKILFEKQYGGRR